MDQWLVDPWFNSQLGQSLSAWRLDLDFDAVGWLPTAPRGWVE